MKEDIRQNLGFRLLSMVKRSGLLVLIFFYSYAKRNQISSTLQSLNDFFSKYFFFTQRDMVVTTFWLLQLFVEKIVHVYSRL